MVILIKLFSFSDADIKFTSITTMLVYCVCYLNVRFDVTMVTDLMRLGAFWCATIWLAVKWTTIVGCSCDHLVWSIESIQI